MVKVSNSTSQRHRRALKTPDQSRKSAGPRLESSNRGPALCCAPRAGLLDAVEHLVQALAGDHPHFEDGPYTLAKPDFLVHVPKNMGRNLAVVEVKPCGFSAEQAEADLKKLAWFCRNAGYHGGVFLIYGRLDDATETLVARVAEAAGREEIQHGADPHFSSWRATHAGNQNPSANKLLTSGAGAMYARP
jgi:hypothetical protein